MNMVSFDSIDIQLHIHGVEGQHKFSHQKCVRAKLSFLHTINQFQLDFVFNSSVFFCKKSQHITQVKNRTFLRSFVVELLQATLLSN